MEMNESRPLPHYSQMTSQEGLAIERAYARRREMVSQRAKEIAVKPTEISYLLDGDAIADQIGNLMTAFFAQSGDLGMGAGPSDENKLCLLYEAKTLCRMIRLQALAAADIEIPDVDDEAIQAQLRGDR